MRKKRTFAMLLVLVLALAACLTALPRAASAAGEAAIQLGTGGIQSYSTANGYHYIYYGVYTNPIKWRVLDASHTNTSADGMFLLSDVLLGTGPYGDVEFEEYPARAGRTNIRNVWDGSKAQVWCNSFESGNLRDKELAAIIETTKTDLAHTCTTPAGDPSHPDASASFKECYLNGDKIFFLSAAEAENGSYGLATIDSRIASYSGNNEKWWLRSPLNSTGDGYAGYVKDVGNIDTQAVYSDYAARPAFNLDKSKILFSSAATGGKAGDGALAAVGTNATTEWKLTLDDSANRAGFAVTTTPVSVTTAGGSVQIPYTGAVTGTDEYISAMLVQGSGNVLYYGRIMPSTAVDGTATIAIPAGLPIGSYTLKVFNEQYNGDKMTDYASAMKDVTLTVTAPGAVAAPTFSPAAGTYQSAQSVTLSCATAGATIRYTLDGSDPTEASTPFAAGTPIAVSATTTIMAKAFKTGMTASATASATYTIDTPPPGAPDITDPAADEPVTAVEGQPVTLSVTATNATGYQWWVNRGSGFVKISGATDSRYTTAPVTQANNGYQYYCVVTGNGGSATSPIFTLNVTAVPATGDSFTPGLWLGLMALFSAGLAASLLYRRKRKPENR